MATIGIDLGTTYCCVAVSIQGQIEMVPAVDGENTTPSYVAFDEDGDVTVGDTARAYGMYYPQRTIYDIKRMMGQSLSDPLIQEYSKLWPFHLTEENSRIQIQIDWNKFSPQMLLTEICKHLKERAELFLNASVAKAVVSVPGYFNEEQKELTRQACAEVGLEILQLLPDPAAAAIAYHHTNLKVPLYRMHGKWKKNCVIFDFGGGTLNVAVVTFEDEEILIRTIGGDPNLGGEDIDTKLMAHCVNEFKTQHGIDLLAKETWPANDLEKKTKMLRRLKLQCQQKKALLSITRRVVVRIDSIYETTKLEVQITREKFEEINDEIFQKCIDTTKSVLGDSGLGVSETDEVILVGGSSRIPKIQQLLQQFFHRELTTSLNADEAIARGSAIQASRIANNEKMVLIKELYRMKSDLSNDENQKVKELENLNGKLLAQNSTLELQILKLTEENRQLQLKIDSLTGALKLRNQPNVSVEGGENSSKSPEFLQPTSTEIATSSGLALDIGIYLDSVHLTCATFDIKSKTAKTLLSGRFLLDREHRCLVEKTRGKQGGVDVFVDFLSKEMSKNDSRPLMEEYFIAVKRKLKENGHTWNRVAFTALSELTDRMKNMIQEAGKAVITHFRMVDYPSATMFGFNRAPHSFHVKNIVECFVVKNENQNLQISWVHCSFGEVYKKSSRSCSYSFDGSGDFLCSSAEVRRAFNDPLAQLFGKKGLFIFTQKEDQVQNYVLGSLVASFIGEDNIQELPLLGISMLAHQFYYQVLLSNPSIMSYISRIIKR